MLILRQPWAQQPPTSDLVAAGNIPPPTAIFRPSGARHLTQPGLLNASTYTNVTHALTRNGAALLCAGASGDGIKHTFNLQNDRNNYAVAVMFRVDSYAAGNQTVFGLNQVLQVRLLSASQQVEVLAEGIASLATSTYAGYVAGSYHTMVVTNRSGGPLVVFSNGAERVRYASGQDVGVTDNYLTIGKRGGASEAFTGPIIEAAYWSGVEMSDYLASAISNDYFGTVFEPRRIWVPVSTVGIAFDAAGNSGDIAAASSYSGSASWSGTNRFLAVDVSMLGPGVTVSSMTYGGAACTLVGVKSTVTSFGRVEQWRICSSDSGAPAAGSNTLAVTLSGSLEFAVEWASYTGVHQTSPTEGFNSAQATNAGSATDASVSVTSVADNCWIHAAVVANDTSITAGNTSRNNVAGTLGSGANEDNGAAKTPAGAVTMSYSGMGITTTWAIAGYAIRPLAASGLGSTGTLATTNAADTSAAAGTTTVTGTFARTNANDTSSASGTTAVLGSLARTNANDTSSASGTTTVTGTSATTNANDTSVAAGTTPDTSPASTGQKPAGRPSKKRRRLEVEIDGEVFDVSSPEQARAVIDQAQAQAEELAAIAVRRAVAAKTRPQRKVMADARRALLVPRIDVPEEFEPYALKVRSDIEALYQSTMRTIEIATLMDKRQRQEEDDEDVLLLLT